MFVYIKDYCNRIQCFPDVTLRDGCVPEFGVRKLEKEITKDLEGIEMLVEPAIWFKVLILDSVSIDCAKRKVLWTTCSQCRLTGQDRGWGFVYCAHVKELYHTSGECYDYDADLDDIFDLATCLLNDMPDMMSLLRLLHCYILPMITLNVEDLNVSKEALQQQIHSIHQLDHELNKKTGEMTKIKEFLLQKARELAAFLQGRDEIVHKSNREFLKALLSFLPTIEEEKRSELNSCQERVQNAKLEVSNCSEEATVQLDCARHDRDMSHHHLEEILSLRENINNLILFDIDEWYELKSSEEEFIHNTDWIEELKTEAMHIMDKKKRAISVREALNHAIQDLKLGKETTGVDISLLSGESATDVLKRGSWPTMWQSLSERITMLVNSKSHPIGRMHHDFCNHVNKYCRNAMEEDLISNNSSLDISTVLQLQQSNNWSTSSNHTENVNGRKTTLTDDDFVELDFPLMNPYKDKVNQITAEIKKHFTKVIGLLQQAEDNQDPMFFRKLWRCYEQCFYERTMQNLAHLYERAYINEQNQLQHNLPTITMKKLEIQEDWILDLLCHPLVLEDPGFIDGSLGSSNPTEQVQRMQTPTNHVDTLTEHVQVSTNINENSEHVQFALACFDNISGTSSDSASSSHQLRSRTAVPVSDSSLPATIVQRKEDTLDRQKNGQKQLSLVLSEPQTDSVCFNKKMLETVTVKNTVDSGNEHCTDWGTAEVFHDTKDSESKTDEEISQCDTSSLYSHESDVSCHDDDDEDDDDDDDDDESMTSEHCCAMPIPQTSGHEHWKYMSCGSIEEKAMQVMPANELRRQNVTFLENVRSCVDCITGILHHSSLMRKLQSLTKCLQQMNSLVTELLSQQSAGRCEIKALTGDDMPTMLLVLLIHCDPKDVTLLLPQIHMMYDLMAPFLESGCHGCSLTQFYVCYDFLLAKMETQTQTFQDSGHIMYATSI